MSLGLAAVIKSASDIAITAQVDVIGRLIGHSVP